MATSLKYMKIRDQILNNALIAGADRLPSEKEICSMYNVSRTTAIKALNSLADDNLVRREVGRGTFFNASNVASTVHVLVDGTFPDMPSFLQEIAQQHQKIDPLLRIEICPVGPRDWVHAIAVNPGVKLVIATHIGYLAEMGLLQPLNKLDEFYDISSHLREEYIEWHHIRPHEPACYSLPFSVDPWLFGYDRVRAKELGLNAATGPESFPELVEWMKVATAAGCESSMLRGAEPLSEYLTFSAGKQFIREENDEVWADDAPNYFAGRNAPYKDNKYAAIFRWREHFQNDFAARLDWCVKNYKEANHPPVANVKGQLLRTAHPSETVKLSAEGSSDPDGNNLSYHWYFYRSAGTCNRDISIGNATSINTGFKIPDTAKKGEEIHIILTVQDNGHPKLTRYKRVVVTVK